MGRFRALIGSIRGADGFQANGKGLAPAVAAVAVASGTYGEAKRLALAYQEGKAAVRSHFRESSGLGQMWSRRSGYVPDLEEF